MCMYSMNANVLAYWREWLDRLDQFQKMFAYDLNEIPDE